MCMVLFFLSTFYKLLLCSSDNVCNYTLQCGQENMFFFLNLTITFGLTTKNNLVFPSIVPPTIKVYGQHNPSPTHYFRSSIINSMHLLGLQGQEVIPATQSFGYMYLILPRNFAKIKYWIVLFFPFILNQ